MPLHLLGISRRGDLTEADCHQIRWVVHGALTAATVWPLTASFGPLQHGHVLAAIHRRIGILPVRHGTVLPNEEAVQEFLGSRCQDLLRDLDRLEGTAEIGLRIELPHSPLPAEPFAPVGPCRADVSPVAYMAARRARYQQRDRLGTQADLAADTCIQSLGGLSRDWRRLSPTAPGIVRLAFLVERNRTEAFAQRVEILRTKNIGGRYALVGPWPPYSFV
jgi:hypothetical protein